MSDQGQGSTADYCSAYPAEPHHMVSHSAGQHVRWVEICSLCGWIDTLALDGWAENFLKEQLSARAQRIAVATETEPFAFVQPPSGELDLREILLQALAASQAEGIKQGLNASDGKRLSAILRALEGEVERAIREAVRAGGESDE